MLPDTQLTLRGIGGTPFKVPVARVHLKWEAKEGPKEVGVHLHLPTEVLMGNDLEEWPHGSQRALVPTRSQSQRGADNVGPGKDSWQRPQGPIPVDTGSSQAGTPDLGRGGGQVPIPASAAEFQAEVQADPSLQRLRDQAGLHAAQPRGRGGQERFLRERGLLFREWLPPRKARAWRVERQLVVPRKYRLKLLYLAHDVPVGGHRGIRSTRLKLLQHFYWPGIFTAVQRYCRSCDSCQRGGKAQDRRKAAWGSLPQIDPLGLLRELWEGKSSLDGASGVEAALAVQRRLAGLMAPARETLARDQGQRKGGCDPRGQACASRPGAGRRVDRGKPAHVGPRHGRPESRGAPMSPGRVPTQRTRTSLGHERSDPAQFALGGGRTVT